MKKLTQPACHSLECFYLLFAELANLLTVEFHRGSNSMPIMGAINPAVDSLEAFAVQSSTSVPPPMNSLYLRDGVHDAMTREDVTKDVCRLPGTDGDEPSRLFHGGLVDKASGQQSATNEFAAYQNDAFHLFFIWEWVSVRWC